MKRKGPYDWIDQPLCRWGEWLATHEDTGFSSTSLLWKILNIGHVDMEATDSRPLCGDMPPEVWRVHFAITPLRTPYKRVLTVKYALIHKEDGTTYTNQDKAALLEVSRETFRQALREGKCLVAHNMFAKEGQLRNA